MKTRILIMTSAFFVSGFVFFAYGTILFSEVSKAIEEYPTKPLDIAGSAGPPYPSYDGTWIYFEVASVSFAGEILLIIWKRR